MIELTNEALTTLINQTDALQLIDVRTPGEYHGLGHIPKAVNLPVQTIDQWQSTLDLSQPIALICQHGRRSVFAAQRLAQLGADRLYNLTEGMAQWQGPLE